MSCSCSSLARSVLVLVLLKIRGLVLGLGLAKTQEQDQDCKTKTEFGQHYYLGSAAHQGSVDLSGRRIPCNHIWKELVIALGRINVKFNLNTPRYKVKRTAEANIRPKEGVDIEVSQPGDHYFM
ncbi:jg12924 [Pararge aegeria aegeria]|uniref:Jg12924 protein n=1 Tax=Pararge aegeria aegeria TaxID=348720 RepID=A0A8S4SF49_9NEOP|nr:jg12924 [Pararge aegeria aegeria]